MGEGSGRGSGRVRLFVGNRGSGRVGSTFRPGRVGSGPRKVTRGQLWSILIVIYFKIAVICRMEANKYCYSWIQFQFLIKLQNGKTDSRISRYELSAVIYTATLCLLYNYIAHVSESKDYMTRWKCIVLYCIAQPYPFRNHVFTDPDAIWSENYTIM